MTLFIILVVWFVGAILAFKQIKDSDESLFGKLIMSCSSWGIFLLKLIHWIHNKG